MLGVSRHTRSPYPLMTGRELAASPGASDLLIYRHNPRANLLQTKGRMVGGTGIEPVTPTMSMQESAERISILLIFLPLFNGTTEAEVLHYSCTI